MKPAILLFVMLILTGTAVVAGDFDYGKVNRQADEHMVIVNSLIEVSFGTQTTEIESRGLGTIVSDDGLVLFDGMPLDDGDPFSVMTGMQMVSEPKKIEVVKRDGTVYPATYIGLDRYSRFAFCRIDTGDSLRFKSLHLKKEPVLKIGDMLIAYMLLPDYVSPSMALDMGMVTAILQEPEPFVLTIGFNEMELGSVVFDSVGNPLGIMGMLTNPALSAMGPGQMLESFSGAEDFMALMGPIGAAKINKLIADPPTAGKVDRGWLGIYLQALTDDIAEFWGIATSGGIIVNDVVENSPADSAGLATGDIIIAMNEKPIKVDREESLPIFQRGISELGAGSEIRLSILRRQDGNIDTLDITAILTQAPLAPSEAPDYEDTQFEFTIRDMVFADYNLYNLDAASFGGVVVKEMEMGGWASVGGIEPGDIIQSIDGQRVMSLDDARAALEAVSDKKPSEVVFFVWREDRTVFINIKTEW